VPRRDRVAVVCLRVDSPTEIVRFASLAEAAEAAAELYSSGPCGPDCGSKHAVCWTVAGVGSFVATLRCDPPVVPADLASALVAAGYRRPSDGVDHWPRPTILNRPLPPREAITMTPETRRRLQDEAVAASNRVIESTAEGLGGRVVAEHDAGVAALAAGDIDAAIGCDIAAKALSAALLAERPSESSTRTAL
jgi:hypothetical protein